MIKLYQFPALWGLPNVSPFCMKLETYLRMTKINFEIVNVSDPRKAPKQKFPFIKDEGLVIADTSLIIEYLKNKYGDVLDANLTLIQKAEALALQRLFEEHLYWIMVYTRWVNPLNWPLVKKTFFGKTNFVMRNFISELIRKNTKRTIYAQGIGRHKPNEIEQMGLKDLQAVRALLGEKPFFMGNEATSIDACAYAFIANILHAPLISSMTDYVKSEQGFVDYCERMKKKFY